METRTSSAGGILFLFLFFNGCLSAERKVQMWRWLFHLSTSLEDLQLPMVLGLESNLPVGILRAVWWVEPGWGWTQSACQWLTIAQCARPKSYYIFYNSQSLPSCVVVRRREPLPEIHTSGRKLVQAQKTPSNSQRIPRCHESLKIKQCYSQIELFSL